MGHYARKWVGAAHCIRSSLEDCHKLICMSHAVEEAIAYGTGPMTFADFAHLATFKELADEMLR